MDLSEVIAATETTTGAPVAMKATPIAKAFTVTHETAETTLLALAEHYDARRDRQAANAAKVLSAYGKEVEGRGAGFTAALAAPLLAELRRFLELAERANASAAHNRELYNESK